jgi:hypothetical protein
LIDTLEFKDILLDWLFKFRSGYGCCGCGCVERSLLSLEIAEDTTDFGDLSVEIVSRKWGLRGRSWWYGSIIIGC